MSFTVTKAMRVTLLPLFLLQAVVRSETDLSTDGVQEQLRALTDYVQDLEARRTSEITSLKKMVDDQMKTMESMWTMMTEMRTTLADQSETITEMRTTLAEQSETITEMRTTLAEQSEKITPLQTQDASITSSKHEEYISHGCFGDTLTLDCSGNTVIQVNSAYYGNFANCSDGTCCVPDPGNDCQESVETNSPHDWEGLLQACDNQTSCEVPHAGGLLPSCDPTYAEYLTIRFHCETMDAIVGSVGFTAYTTADIILDQLQTVIFDGVVSNYGGAYDSTTGEFTCPVTGIYMFSLNVMNAADDFPMEADIMKGSSALLRVYCNAFHRKAASNTFFGTCQNGEIVYVRTTDMSNLRMHGDPTDRYSSFSGFLMSAA